MDENTKAVKERIRRSVVQEFVRQEDDFDYTRDTRKEISDKLMENVRNISLLDDKGEPKEDTDTSLRIIGAALKTLSDIEKANVAAVNLKLRNQEQEMANAADTKERIAIILRATAPGRIEESFPSESLESHLAEMFDAEIKESELKLNPKDLDAD